MASRDPQREQHWRALLGEWQESGRTIYAFCKHRDLQKTTFYYWQRKLGFARTDSPSPLTPPPSTPTTFVPLTLVAEPMAEIVLPAGPVLKLPLASDVESIPRWLAAVRASSC